MPMVDRQTATAAKNESQGKAGRMIVSTPGMDGDQYPLPIEAVMPCGLIAHAHPGDTLEIELPDGEDIVEHPQEAKYFGKRWDDANDYPSKFKTNYPDRRGFYTPGGHYLIFDDKDKVVMLETKDGHILTLDDKNGKVSIKNIKSGDEWSNTLAGLSTIEGTTKTHLKSPLTDLNDISTDFLIKGTTYNISEQALVTAFSAAHTKWLALIAKWVALAAAGGPWIPQVDQTEVNDVATAMGQLTTAITTFQGAVASWTSLKTKTG